MPTSSACRKCAPRRQWYRTPRFSGPDTIATTAKNVGWRLDYQVVSPKLESRVEKAEIYPAERLSDHAPLIMDYDRNR